MVRALLSLSILGVLLLVIGCHETPSTPGKPSKPAGTPPPSASNIPPPTQPGHSSGTMR